MHESFYSTSSISSFLLGIFLGVSFGLYKKLNKKIDASEIVCRQVRESLSDLMYSVQEIKRTIDCLGSPSIVRLKVREPSHEEVSIVPRKKPGRKPKSIGVQDTEFNKK